MWDEIIYPFLNFNGATVEVWKWDKKFHLTLYQASDYLSMLGLKLNHVSIRGPWSFWGQSTSEHWLDSPHKGPVMQKMFPVFIFRAHSRFAPSQWETSLQSNAISHWLGADLESALYIGQLRAFITTHIIGFHESNNTELYILLLAKHIYLIEAMW